MLLYYFFYQIKKNYFRFPLDISPQPANDLGLKSVLYKKDSDGSEDVESKQVMKNLSIYFVRLKIIKYEKNVGIMEIVGFITF